jgi:hypothetical protein
MSGRVWTNKEPTMCAFAILSLTKMLAKWGCFNSTGKDVKILFNGEAEGTREVMFTSTGQPSGVYLVRLESDFLYAI